MIHVSEWLLLHALDITEIWIWGLLAIFVKIVRTNIDELDLS